MRGVYEGIGGDVAAGCSVWSPAGPTDPRGPDCWTFVPKRSDKMKYKFQRCRLQGVRTTVKKNVNVKYIFSNACESLHT
jgi:hypothetical protein